MSRTLVSHELDEIAGGIETLAKRHPRHARTLKAMAGQLDVVSNQVDKEAASRKDDEDDEIPARKSSRKQAAAPSIEDGMWPFEGEMHDSYEADDYHKVPVGNDSLSKAIDKNVPDVVSELQFAQHTNGKDRHRILVQAGKGTGRAAGVWPFGDITPRHLATWAQRGDWGKVRQAASMALSTTNVCGRRQAADSVAMEVDEGRFGSEDNLSTADLGESGNEEITKPVDADDEGGVLQFFGTFPQRSNDDGPDSGHHRRDVAPPNREVTTASRSARTLLERVADRPVKPEVKQPDELLNDEDGDNVERDNPLGGLSGQYKGRKSGRGAASEIRVYRPEHVPEEMHGLWHRAAQRLSSQGRLLLSSGDVDYYAVDDTYRDALSTCHKRASQMLSGRTASRVRYAATPATVQITRPDYVPKELGSYWNGSAHQLGRQNRLVTASGKVDYDAVTRKYLSMVDHVLNLPTD